MRLLVIRVKNESSPIKGSAVISCGICNLDCWISQSSMSGVLPFQSVKIVCECCAGLCNYEDKNCD